MGPRAMCVARPIIYQFQRPHNRHCKIKSKFPRYNTKCREKRDTTRNIPRGISFSPLYFVLYLGKSITFLTVWAWWGRIKSYCSMRLAWRGESESTNNTDHLNRTVGTKDWFFKIKNHSWAPIHESESVSDKRPFLRQNTVLFKIYHYKKCQVRYRTMQVLFSALS